MPFIAEIVAASGRANPAIMKYLKFGARVGRGLVVLSLAMSIYNVATADDPAQAAKREGAIWGAGILGGAATGAVAGLVCGPGAPACVPVAAFIGGALAAFGVSYAW